jgi:shikimate kinase
MDYRAKKIYLIGFMGSGKTTLGKKLASNLRWTFIDLDRIIENETGLKIPEIFSSKGEAYFRAAETEALRSMDQRDRVVISTGGGAPCSDRNMDFMNGSGLTIYLKLSPDTLYGRLKRSSGERPLLKDLGSEELYDFIVRKLREREKWYSMASLIIDGDNSEIGELVSQVKNWIQE